MPSRPGGITITHTHPHPRTAELASTPGFLQLGDAASCARELGEDVWQFALELEQLQRSGLSHNDLRWLICRNCVEHGEELTRATDRRRRFRKLRSLVLTGRTCFIASESGMQLAGEADRAAQLKPTRPADRGQRRDFPPEAPTVTTSHARAIDAGGRCIPPAPPVPHWDADIHELRLGSEIIKRYSHPAPAQELILSVFQEENWPPGIDDPLTVQFHQDPKRRLHYTIRNLNRGQSPLRIRFFINGNGQTIRWELIPVQRAGDAQSARRRR